MQRRQLLKWALPTTVLFIGAAAGYKLLGKTSCNAGSLTSLLARLKPFSDSELGKKAQVEINAEVLKRFGSFCEPDFDQRYRQLVMDDFAQDKTTRIDGWILSETEALTQRLVYQSAQ